MRTRRTAETRHNETKGLKFMTDFTKATKEDIPTIVETIRALRRLTLESGMITTRTQSTILRNLPADLLLDVATELNAPNPSLAALSGDAKAR
jgi:hypothetical protein